MELNNIKIKNKTIFNPESKESLNDRKIFGGKIMATKWTQDTIIIKLKELHPNLDFSKFIFTSVNNKSIIICPIHGSREMKVMNLLRGSSCKLCKQQSQKRTPTQII